MASRAPSALARAGVALLAFVVVLGVAKPAAACSRGLPEGTTVGELLRTIAALAPRSSAD